MNNPVYLYFGSSEKEKAVRILSESPIEQLVGAGLMSGIVVQVVGVISVLAGEEPIVIEWLLLGGSILTTVGLAGFLAFFKRNVRRRLPISSIVPLAGSMIGFAGTAWWIGRQGLPAFVLAVIGPILVLVGLVILTRSLQNPS